MTTKTLSIDIPSGQWVINIFRGDDDNIEELRFPDSSNQVDNLVHGHVYSVAVSVAATAGTEFTVSLDSKQIAKEKTDENNMYTAYHFVTA